MQARNMTDLQGNGLVLVYDNTAVKSNKKKIIWFYLSIIKLTVVKSTAIKITAVKIIVDKEKYTT